MNEFFPIYDEDGNEYDDLLFRKCKQCLEVKPKSEFYTNITFHDKLASTCKDCVREYYYTNREDKLKYERNNRDRRNELRKIRRSKGKKE